jgi:chemotaxis protein CheX
MASSVDFSLITPLYNAAILVLEVQCNATIKANKPFKKTELDVVEIGIAGVIAINSSRFTGTVSICFSEQVFLKLYEGMVGEEHAKITDEIADAASEILNIIYGAAKKEMNEKGGTDLGMAIPTVIRGGSLKLSQSKNSETVIIPFSSSFGSFHMEISLMK